MVGAPVEAAAAAAEAAAHAAAEAAAAAAADLTLQSRCCVQSEASAPIHRQRPVLNSAHAQHTHSRWLVHRVLVAVAEDLDAVVPQSVQLVQRHARVAVLRRA
jgi:hypothetical protein